MESRDERMMRECFSLARKGRGHVSPNPMVGALLARGETILARGYHKRFGGPHAEVDCLRSYRGSFANTTLYVNLEPCCYHGKTPPCTDLIIERGVPRVVFGMRDPNPRVSGKGIAILRKNGVTVVEGVLAAEAGDLNRMFSHSMATQRPYVHMKVAQTLDGKIAARSDHPLEISSRQSRQVVHQWRSWYDAVLVGAGTVKADNPRVTVRLAQGRNPDVIVLDGNFKCALSANVMRPLGQRRTFLCVEESVLKKKSPKAAKFTRQGVVLIPCKGEKGVIQIRPLLKLLYTQGIGSILVEGGSEVFTRFSAEDMVDELSIFIAPKVLGQGVPAFADLPKGKRPTRRRGIGRIDMIHIGEDILLRTRFR